MTIRKPLLALAAIATLASAWSAAASTPFDGAWEVQVFSEDTDCEIADAVPIRVADGNVRYRGWFGPSTTGQVTPDGALQVRFAYLGDVVDVAGRLQGATGVGQWVSPTLECIGTWVAART